MLVVRHPNGRQYTINNREEYERFYRHRGFTVVREDNPPAATGGDGDAAATAQADQADPGQAATDDQAQGAAIDSASGADGGGVYTAAELNAMNVPELRDLARANAVEGQSGMNKRQLVEALTGKPKAG